MICKAAEDLITGLVDNELSYLERQWIEGHIKNCSRCRYAYRQKWELKAELFSMGSRITAPAGLRDRILADSGLSRDRADSTETWVDRFRFRESAYRPVFALTILILLVLPALYLMGPKKDPISLALLDVHGKVTAGEVSLFRAGSQGKIKDYLVRSASGKFEPMGHDLTATGFKAVGGFVREIGGRMVLVTVYEGHGFHLSSFTLFANKWDVLPEANYIFDSAKQIPFQSFTKGGVNGVMHRVGKRNCLFVSKIPTGQLLAMTRSIPQKS